jgi:hypothetical protein
MLEIIKNDLDRAITDEAAALDAGFALKAPLYALGTPVDTFGVNAYRASRRAFDELPRLRDVVDEAVARIRGEQRVDRELTLGDLAMQHTGRVGLGVFGDGGARITRHAFGQLVRRAGLPAGAAGYLTACPAPLRAANLDEWLPRAAHMPSLVRARREHGEPTITAVLGTRYRPFDADAVSTAMLESAPIGARGEVQYDGSRFELRATWHSDIAPDGAVAGELFKAFVAVETADDGSRAIRVRSGVVRNLCRNFLVLDVAEQESAAAHRGADLPMVVRKLIHEAHAKVAHFAEVWTAARRDKVLDGIYGAYDSRPVFAELVRQGLVEVPGVEDDEMVARLVRAWEREPGNTKADVINAITRAAHEEPWSSPWTSGALEEQAGRLLHARVVLG